MLYAAMVFWLLILVFAAYGTYQLWAGLIKPHILNFLLLPGTLIAQTGRMVGILLTGGTLSDTSLTPDTATVKSSKNLPGKKKLPVIGAVLVALLPILACGLSIHVVLLTIGQQVLVPPEESSAAASLPLSFDSLWELLRSSIAVAEWVAGTVLNSDFGEWQSWLFVYLIICLSVRMAPMPGTHRGAIGAVMLIGIMFILVGQYSPSPEVSLQTLWRLLNFTVGILLCLLVISLMVRGGVGLFHIITNQTKLK